MTRKRDHSSAKASVFCKEALVCSHLFVLWNKSSAQDAHQEVCLLFGWVRRVGGGRGWTGKETVMPRYTDHVKSPSPPNTNCMKTEVVKAAFDQVPAGCCVRKTARALIANWPRHRILREKLFFPPRFIWLTPLPASFSPPRLPTKALRWPALNPISNKTRRPASSPWCQRRYLARMRVVRRLADWSVLWRILPASSTSWRRSDSQFASCSNDPPSLTCR